MFKNPQDAFPLIAKEWTTKAKAVAENLDSMKGEASVEVVSRIDGLLFQLDSKNASLQQKCCAAYVVYKVDPCGKDGWLEREVRTILAEESVLRRMDVSTEQVRLAIDGGLPAADILARLDAAFMVLMSSESDIRRREQFEKSPQLAHEWSKEPVG